MKRKFLEDLGLRRRKQSTASWRRTERIWELVKAERDTYKTRLDEATETLKSFEGVDVKELQGKITNSTGDLAAKGRGQKDTEPD